MVEAGLRLEDKPDGSSVWKLDDPEAMKAENAAKAQAAAEAKLKKLRNKLDLKLRERERFEKAMAPPEKYSRFDETTGNPTHLKDGTALEGKVSVKPSSFHLKSVSGVEITQNSVYICLHSTANGRQRLSDCFFNL